MRIELPEPHTHQRRFIDSPAKRRVVRAGRRGGKTYGMVIFAAELFLQRRRILYAVPTQEQLDRFWTEIKRIFAPLIDAGVVYKNETRHLLEWPDTDSRIRAKTAWNADTLRGDFADVLILDEYQLMAEDAWGVVGAPMLLQSNGDAVFVYTPPSLRSLGVSKARDPRHAAKLYATAAADTSGRWQAFTFTSHDNPFLNRDALRDIAKDMTDLAYRQEILAEDIDSVPGALWTAPVLDASRVTVVPDLVSVVVGVDPGAGGQGGDQTGIVAVGRDARGHVYVLDDATCSGDVAVWPSHVVDTAQRWQADRIIAEANNGGTMVRQVIQQAGAATPVQLVHASRGKHTRAEPISVLWQPLDGSAPRGHMVGVFGVLEQQCRTWLPGMDSPNNLDAMVWACHALSTGGADIFAVMDYYARAAASVTKEPTHATH